MSRHDNLTSSQIEPVPSVLPDDDDRLQIDLRLTLDEVAAAEEKQLRRGARRHPSKRDLLALAGRIYDSRRSRERIFSDHELFGEPAWDMLLALYCLPPRGELMAVTALTYAANVPETTGMRWQRTLINEGLIERGPELVDQRRQINRLTPRGRCLLERYLTRLFYSDAPTLPGSN